MSYIEDTVPISLDTHNLLDTVMYGYEVDSACIRYEQEYSKLDTTLNIISGINKDSLNVGIIKANIINTLYDKLETYNQIDAGYESMIESGKDILLAIWKFIKDTILKLFKFLKKIYDSIIKFISGLFKDEHKQDKQVDKLIKKIDKDMPSISIGSGGSSGGAGVDTSSPTGTTNIDDKAEKIYDSVNNDINNNSDTVKTNIKVINKLQVLSKKFSVFTHLHGYFGITSINNYLDMSQSIQTCNTTINDSYNILTGKILGNKTYKESSIIKSAADALCELNNTKELSPNELHAIYDPVINNVKSYIRYSINSLNNLNGFKSIYTKNEYTSYFIDLIKKKDKLDDSALVLITYISTNSIGYVKLKKSPVIVADDVQSVDNRIDILNNILNRSKSTNDTNVINYISENDNDITNIDIINSINSVLRGYTLIGNLLYLERGSYIVEPSSTGEDFFNNRSIFVVKNIKTRLLKYKSVIGSNLAVSNNLKDIIYKVKDNSTLELVIKDIDKCMSNHKDNNQSLSTALNSLNKVINDYSNMEITVNKLALDNINKNKMFMDDLISLENYLISTSSVFIMSEVRS